MQFFLNATGDKSLEVVFTNEGVRMKFICGSQELDLHPQAFQKMEALSLETSSSLLQLLQGFPVLLRKRLFHNVFLYIRPPCHMVHIQKFVSSYGVLFPTSEGIAMTTSEWLKLLDVIIQLKNAHAIFNVPNMCFRQHSSTGEKEQCYNCHSDGFPTNGVFAQSQNHQEE